MKRRHVLVLGLLLATTLGRAQTPTPVPVIDEPYHHVKLKNDDVVVIRAILPSGEQTAYHIHSCDRTGVELSTNTTTAQRLGEAEEAPLNATPGYVFSDSCAGKPLIHRVHNTGNTTMDVIDIEFFTVQSVLQRRPRRLRWPRTRACEPTAGCWRREALRPCTHTRVLI